MLRAFLTALLHDGRPLALVSASCFGIITSIATIAYDGGASPMTLAVLRAGVAGFVLALWLRLAGKLFVYAKELPTLLLLALCNMGISIGVLGSVFFIPVSLAAIIFYTFPLIIAGANAAFARRLPSRRESLYFAVAFVGLALVIGPKFTSLDWRGIALACLASLSATGMFLVAERRARHLDDMSVSCQVNLLGALLAGLGVMFWDAGLFSWPESDLSLGLTIMVCGLYLIAMMAFFPAVRHAGSAKAALVFNVEPVVSILGAVLILGEVLSLYQWLGGALVIGTLVASSLARRHHAAPPPPGRPV
ncbi:MAG: DMT family transporter [Limibacillus sp.]|jgi:drug/metabolite transporter (DMT)-like permease